MFSCKQRTFSVPSDMELCHPEDYENEELIEVPNLTSELEVFSCDACDKSFTFEKDYEVHMSQHKVCNIDGCIFNAHEKILEKHIRLQHSTGLYDRIRNISTPEDIKKWIEDRRNKYPNIANIQRRYEEQEERIKRGDRIVKGQKRFGENKFRSMKIRNKKKVYQAEKKRKKTLKKPEKSLIPTENTWNKMFPFKGTQNLYEQDTPKDEEEKYEDDEWSTHASNNVVIKNSLGALMGAYMSDDESDEVESPVKIGNTQNSLKEISEKEKSTEITDNHTIIETSTNSEEPPLEIRINKTCNIENVNNLENRTQKKVNRKKTKTKKHEKKVIHRPQFSIRKHKITLLEKLLENDIVRERNILLQCIRYIVNTKLVDK